MLLLGYNLFICSLIIWILCVYFFVVTNNASWIFLHMSPCEHIKEFLFGIYLERNCWITAFVHNLMDISKISLVVFANFTPIRSV